MWMQTEHCDGYKVRGLQEQRDAGWRITTWPEGRDEPEKRYWVKNGVFYKVGTRMASAPTVWQEPSLGPVDTEVQDEEKAAVLKLVGKWNSQISPSSLRERE